MGKGGVTVLANRQAWRWGFSLALEKRRAPNQSTDMQSSRFPIRQLTSASPKVTAKIASPSTLHGRTLESAAT